MLIISAIVRVVERFSIHDSFFNPGQENYGCIIGIEIAITWATLLVAEYIIAIKFFQVSSQMPAVVTGYKSLHDINTRSIQRATLIGTICNIVVSVWPGVLYASTYYKKEHSDLRSVFWEFEIAIWLNALCRLVSLGIFAVAICRINDCIKLVQSKVKVNGSMICLNWALVILAASVQVTLIIFYSLGLAYEDSEVFQKYTMVMMYFNVACTCGAQVILSFIFSIMSEQL